MWRVASTAYQRPLEYLLLSNPLLVGDLVEAIDVHISDLQVKAVPASEAPAAYTWPLTRNKTGVSRKTIDLGTTRTLERRASAGCTGIVCCAVGADAS